MPKRPTKNPETQKSLSSAQDKISAWEWTKAFASNSKVQLVGGIILFALSIGLFIACISYLFHGAEDISNLTEESGTRNSLGPLGARLSNFFIDKTFGLSFFAIIVMSVLFSIALMGAKRIKAWRVFFCSVFWLLWGSVSLGFFDLCFHLPLFFRIGGAHGEWLAGWLLSNIEWIGTLIVQIAILMVFLVLTSEKTVPTLIRMWEWTKHLFKRKPKAEVAEEAADSEIVDSEIAACDGDVIIEEPVSEMKEAEETGLDLDNLLGQSAPSGEEEAASDPDDLPFTIENTSSEEDSVVAQSVKETIGGNAGGLISEELNEEPDLTIERPTDTELVEDQSPEALLRKLGPYDPRADLSNYHFPGLDLLKVYDNENSPVINPEEQKANATRIVTTLRNYGVNIESIKATVGPTVTLYEVVPEAGTRVAKIQSLENDIMMSLSANGIRIIAPIPGKGTVGIEVPNEKPQTVSMHSVIASKRFQEDKKLKLPVAIGRTITNEIFMFDLAKTPHLLVAGATGQGKSVAINAIITSLLYKKHPAEMKFVLVDPKMVEFSLYKPLIKHYLAAMPDSDPEQVVITDCDKVINTLNSLVIEMENRYKLLMDAGVRNLEEYNEKFTNRRLNPEKLVADELHHRFLPYIVIIIDEFGDFIMQAGKQVETPIARITQKARAVGMHMILATQRPSTNIVTGVIKANIPTRIALRTQSVTDSRVILDAKGADQLIGRGDMLYSGNGDITRIQCAFVDTPEVDAIVDHIKVQQSYFEPYELPEYVGENGGEEGPLAPGAVDLKKLDPMFRDVATYVVTNQMGSSSILQRRFQIGYNRAGKLSDQLEAAGIVGPNKGSKGRDVLIQDLAMLDLKFQELNI